MEEEIWKDIPGYEGKYQASNLGRIKSMSRMIYSKNQSKSFYWNSQERILSPGRRDKCGHISVVLHNPKKSFGVHQLVMLAFEGPVPKGKCVLHSNGNPQDNRLSNLRYNTQSENILDVYRQGSRWKRFNIEDIQEIRFYLFCGFKVTEVARIFDSSHQAISKIKNGDRYKWLR
ncbi:HNH endonuclease [Lactococcus lactis RTB018]|uniref:Phage-related HNH endonuclease family protein n=1 Tax=Lactococcus lactis subsp. lactis TaxID=1360 RepID=A0A1V0NG12_LACLL|nr:MULTISPECIES: NUMOD4 motif-containing HNH endonuclease [Lactococcus]ARD98866.1 phage-related HNH endonuclease family protein [Lactococcus lactis subsp. lactis]NHI69374.1 hypothetical protein [Lactococcus garvieae]NHJ06471.1 hypothetical protein [Lactococcus garvieae]OAZ17147.1 HNH endonuclease [Lactococcus lactis RTB018]